MTSPSKTAGPSVDEETLIEAIRLKLDPSQKGATRDCFNIVAGVIRAALTPSNAGATINNRLSDFSGNAGAVEATARQAIEFAVVEISDDFERFEFLECFLLGKTDQWPKFKSADPSPAALEPVEPEELEELIGDRSANRAADAILGEFVVTRRALIGQPSGNAGEAAAPAPCSDLSIGELIEWLHSPQYTNGVLDFGAVKHMAAAAELLERLIGQPSGVVASTSQKYYPAMEQT